MLGPLAPFLVNYGPRFVSWLMESLDIDRENLHVLYLSTVDTARSPKPAG
jgi:hypothetical protein